MVLAVPRKDRHERERPTSDTPLGLPHKENANPVGVANAAQANKPEPAIAVGKAVDRPVRTCSDESGATLAVRNDENSSRHGHGRSKDEGSSGMLGDRSLELPWWMACFDSMLGS